AYALEALVASAGGLPIVHPITPDAPDAIRRQLEEALTADVVVSSGGVSVGEYDFVKAAFAAAGLTLDFWRVAMQPGKPVAFGRAGEKLGFGLPGNPASSMVSFELFVAPALRKLAGLAERLLRPRVTVLWDGAPLRKEAGRRQYVRVE